MLARSLLVVVMVAALMFVLWRHRRHDEPPASDGASGATTTPEPRADDAPKPTTGPARAIRKVTPDERAAIADAIAKAQASRAARADRAQRPSGSAVQPSSDAVNEFAHGLLMTLHEVTPYLAGCYDDGHGKHLTTAVVRMNFSGDPDIGTLIDPDTMVDGDGNPLDRNISECLRTTLQSLELPPLAEGSRMSAKFSFDLGDDSQLAPDAGL